MDWEKYNLKKEQYIEKMKIFSDNEKSAICDYAELAMQGNQDAQKILKKIFGQADSMGDYDILMREAYNSMSESGQVHQINDAKMRLKYNPPLRLNPKSVINKLSAKRIDTGLTQKELSEKSGVNIRQIQRYESASSEIGNMTLKNALAIAEALECDVSELL